MKRLFLILLLCGFAYWTYRYADPSGLFGPIQAGMISVVDLAEGSGESDVDYEKLYSRIKDPQVLAYAKKTEEETLREYDKLNSKDQEWYADGRKAARLFAYNVSVGDNYGEGLIHKAEKFAKAAWLKSCRDPIVLAACDAYNFRLNYSVSVRSGNFLLHNVDALLASGYPVICKFEGVAVAMNNLTRMAANRKPSENTSSVTAKAPVYMSKAMTAFQSLVQTRPSEETLFWKTTMFLDFVDRNPMFLNTAGSSFDRILTANGASGALRAYVQGDVLINKAWASRGGGWADTVTSSGWAGMRSNLQQAAAVLKNAAPRFPKEPRIPALMITVEMGGDGNRSQMEAWFQKAIEADPDSYRAYWCKMYYLQPKWHGSPKDVLEFGQQCVATDRWSACIPLVFVQGLGEMAETNEKVFAVPEIWDMARKTYERFLQEYPDSVCHRTDYLRAAFQARQWKEAKKQLKILGDSWDRFSMGQKEYDEIVAAVEAA